jgi:hypothetical protein
MCSRRLGGRQSSRSGPAAILVGAVAACREYEGLRKKGMSKSRATRIANDPDSSSKGAKASGGGKKRDTNGQGDTKARQAAAGRKGAKNSS